jgi:hypothetical protein
LAFCIVVAIKQKDANVGLCEPAHLLHEKKASLIVAPFAIIEIARDDDEGDLVFDASADEIVER